MDNSIEKVDDIKIVIDKDGLKWTYLNDKNVCGAKNHQGSGICKKSPLKGRNRCKLHGGATPRGVMSSGFKTGKYSRDLPMRLIERYENSLKDDELIELNNEIAVIESRIGDLLTRVETGESGLLWKKTKDLYIDIKDSVKRNDQVAFARYLNDLGKIINSGMGDYKNWEEVVRTIDVKRKLTESHRKALNEKQQMMTSEQAMILLAFVVSVIKKHVTDQKTLAAISSEIQAHLSSNKMFQNNGDKE